MFKLFGAIGRFFRAMLYTFAGDISKWSEVWESSTGYIHAEYDDIEKEQKTDINELTDAVAGLMDIVSQKEHTLENLSEKIADKKKKMTGAKAKADRRKNEMLGEGKSVDQIKNDATIVKCLDFYNTFKAELEAAQAEAERLGAELEKHDRDLGRYKSRLQKAHGELQKIKSERHETVADMKLSQQEQKVNATLLGISESKTGERRARIQELRRKNRAKADIQSEMAGLATEDAEAEFLEFASADEGANEFFDMLGLEDEKKSTVSDSAGAESETHIPE